MCLHKFVKLVTRSVVSGVTDRGGRGAHRPPWQAKCKKWAPLRDFMNCWRWKCFYKFWKSVGLDILNTEIVQCLANQQSSNELQIQSCCSAAACIVQKIILNVHTVCDVIIPCRCGTLPPFAAIIFLLALDCVMELWISLCLKVAMCFSLRLEYRESCVVTLQSYLFCKAN